LERHAPDVGEPGVGGAGRDVAEFGDGESGAGAAESGAGAENADSGMAGAGAAESGAGAENADSGMAGAGAAESGAGADKGVAIETTKEPSTSYRHKKADVSSIKTQQPIHPSTQMTLFSGPALNPSVEILLEKLQASDPDRMTPIDALMLLTELKRLQDS